MMTEDGGHDFARLGKTPAEQAAAAVRPFSVLVWTATEIMHWAGVQGSADLAIATAVTASLAWGASARGWVPSALPPWIALAGGWTAAAWYLGPIAWLPAPMLTVVWIILTWAAHRAAHRHPAVCDAREWRAARARWLAVRNSWGFGGTHLLAYEETRIGEIYVVSTKGTDKRASQYVSRAREEDIAQAEDLPPGRVQIRPHELAGRVIISVRRINPWAEPLLHPLTGENDEVEVPERRSIFDLATVGQDPETGAPLQVPLYDRETGGKNVSLTGIKGAGKDVLLDNLAEHVTACGDAILVWIDVSAKGYGGAGAWGPACHLTAFGPQAKARAVAVVRTLSQVIEWRARAYKRGGYDPSPHDPAIVLIVNESDSAAAVGDLKRGLDDIATKGREYGLVYVHAGQRNTNDYHSAKQRSQDDVYCTGMLRNFNEMRHASAGSGTPNMATYGEGKPGVWSISTLGGIAHNGRTWVFAETKAAHGAMVESIAAERAFSQLQLPGDCQEYLGVPYLTLLASDVFPRWAQDRGYTTGDGMPDHDDIQPTDTPHAAQPDDGAGTAPAIPTASTATAVADYDIEEAWSKPMDETATARNVAIHKRLADAGKILNEAAAQPQRPAIDPADRAAFAAEGWRQVGEKTEIPEQHRPRLLEMVAAGTTVPAVAREIGVTKWTARTWLEALRHGGLAYVDGERRGAQWKLTPPPAATQGEPLL